jgi:hypothetical protein
MELARRRGRARLTRPLLWAVALVAALAVGAVAWSIAQASRTEATTCLDAPVTEATVLTYGRGLEGATGAEFARRHDIASYGADFWSQRFDGERPVDALADAVRSALASDCALTSVAAQLGVDTATFDETMAQPGGVDAYERIRSRAEELKDAVRVALLEQAPPADADLRAAFAELDDTLKTSDLAVTVLRVHGADALLDGDTSVDVDGIRDRLTAAGADVEELRVDSQEISKEDLYSSQLLEAMQNAQPGDVLAGFGDGERLILVDKLGGGPLTFDQAPQLARNAYVNDLLTDRLDEAVAARPLATTADLGALLLGALPPS